MTIQAIETCIRYHLDQIKGSITQVINDLLQISLVRKEFLKIVSMGPFKHHVDEALETRKVIDLRGNN